MKNPFRSSPLPEAERIAQLPSGSDEYRELLKRASLDHINVLSRVFTIAQNVGYNRKSADLVRSPLGDEAVERVCTKAKETMLGNKVHPRVADDVIRETLGRAANEVAHLLAAPHIVTLDPTRRMPGPLDSGWKL
jgi:hypothetical protein